MSDLSTKQRAAIAALIAGANHQEAAKRAGVHANRISEWLKDAVFVQALRDAEAEALAVVARELMALAGKVRQPLEAALDNQDTPIGARLRAVEIVLDKLLRVRELAVLEERISRLEAMQRGEIDPDTTY